MAASNIMFLACGSYNPPTYMHLRMFELARDAFIEMGHHVLGGIVSPVHDSYGKRGLESAKHRATMVKLSLQSSNWIRLSDWECNHQEMWTKTRQSLQYHQNYINTYINDINGTLNEIIPSWIPEDISNSKGTIQLKLLCGADLLESFAIPGVWSDEDIEAILEQHGLVVVSRNGSNPEKFIFDSDLLTKYKKNITIITNWVANEVSSSIARKLLSRNCSVKYLLDDYVIEYIKQQALYGSHTQNINEKRPRAFCCGDALSVKSLLSRPGGAVQIVTNTMGVHSVRKDENDDVLNDDDDEVRVKKQKTSACPV